MATFAVPPPQTRDWRELPDAKTIDTGTKRLVVFLDYDGTLTPIVEASDAAVLAAPMRAAIARLARHAPVAVVSGRAREKVREFVAVENLYYAGSHGFDIDGPGGLRKQVKTSAAPDPPRGAEPARGLAARVAGASVEDNVFSVSIHWRGVAEADRPRVAGAVDAVLALAPFRTTLRKFSGASSSCGRRRPGTRARRPSTCSTWCARPRAARTTGSTACSPSTRRRRDGRGRARPSRPGAVGVLVARGRVRAAGAAGFAPRLRVLRCACATGAARACSRRELAARKTLANRRDDAAHLRRGDYSAFSARACLPPPRRAGACNANTLLPTPTTRRPRHPTTRRNPADASLTAARRARRKRLFTAAVWRASSPDILNAEQSGRQRGARAGSAPMSCVQTFAAYGCLDQGASSSRRGHARRSVQVSSSRDWSGGSRPAVDTRRELGARGRNRYRRRHRGHRVSGIQTGWANMPITCRGERRATTARHDRATAARTICRSSAGRGLLRAVAGTSDARFS